MFSWFESTFETCSGEFCRLKVIFRFTGRLKTLFRFKYFLEKNILSGILYRYIYSNCKFTFYRKIFWHIFFWTYECIRTSNLTRKSIKSAGELAIYYPLLECDFPITFGGFDILASDSYNGRFTCKMWQAIFE